MSTEASPAAELPRGACDCHMHVYDRRFPAAPEARFCPPDASVADYRALQARLGLQRCVVVTPSTYGFDNRCTVEAMQALGRAGTAARGIAVLRSDIADDALAALHAAGVRGVRFNQTLGGTSLDDLEPLAERIAPLGWHAELLLPDGLWPGIAARVRTLPVPIVFDHFGRLPYPASRHPGHRAILDLLQTGRAWAKLSGAYLHQGVPRAAWAADAQAMTAALLHAAAHRLVWGSNWPHPSVHAGIHEAVDDAELLALLRRWIGDDAAWQRVLVDNPANLYDFR